MGTEPEFLDQVYDYLTAQGWNVSALARPLVKSHKEVTDETDKQDCHFLIIRFDGRK